MQHTIVRNTNSDIGSSIKSCHWSTVHNEMEAISGMYQTRSKQSSHCVTPYHQWPEINGVYYSHVKWFVCIILEQGIVTDEDNAPVIGSD